MPLKAGLYCGGARTARAHPVIGRYIREMSNRAMPRYHGHFDAELFKRALMAVCGTEDRSNVKRSNELIDEAMALCGHPAYGISETQWSPAEMAFLEPFTREWGE